MPVIIFLLNNKVTPHTHSPMRSNRTIIFKSSNLISDELNLFLFSTLDGRGFDIKLIYNPVMRTPYILEGDFNRIAFFNFYLSRRKRKITAKHDKCFYGAYYKIR